MLQSGDTNWTLPDNTNAIDESTNLLQTLPLAAVGSVVDHDCFLVTVVDILVYMMHCCCLGTVVDILVHMMHCCCLVTVVDILVHMMHCCCLVTVVDILVHMMHCCCLVAVVRWTSRRKYDQLPVNTFFTQYTYLPPPHTHTLRDFPERDLMGLQVRNQVEETIHPDSSVSDDHD